VTLQQIRIFLAIVDSGFNITQAADRVHATQPGLSKQLKQLEDHLGLSLVQRKSKSLTGLTPAGEVLLPHARTMVREAGNILELARNWRGSTHGALRIGATHAQARYVLPEMVQKLRTQMPEVSIDLRPGEPDEILELLRKNDIDLAVLSHSSDAWPDSYVLPAYHWRMRGLVPIEHPLASLQRAVKVSDLAQYPIVTYNSARNPGSSLRATFALEGIVPDLACTTRDADSIKAYVKAGLGVGVLSEMAVEVSDYDHLHALDLGSLFPRYTSFVILRRGEVPPKFVRSFIALLAPHYHAHPIALGLDRPEVFAVQVPDWRPAP